MKISIVCGICLIAIAFSAFAIRFYHLDCRPMHHDEANQAVRCGILQETGIYRYDSHEHHGPTLYYFTLPVLWLTSGTDFSKTTELDFRLIPVIFGSAIILLLFLVKDGLGWSHVILSSILTAVSPAMVYYSRFYIQEMLFVFMTFGLVVSGWRYYKTQKVQWAVLAGLFAGLMHATKETCIIAFGAIVLGVLGVWLWPKKFSMAGEAVNTPRQSRLILHLIIGLITAIIVSVLFYSSFFTNWQGPLDSIRALSVYFGRAGGDRPVHVYPWCYYLQILAIGGGSGFPWSEVVILILAIIGFWAVFFGQRISLESDIRFLRFISLYSLATIIVYSMIPYKTPWNMLSMLFGLIIMAGAGAVYLMSLFKGMARVVILCILLADFTHLAWGYYNINMIHSADARNPYAYVQTSSDFLKMVERINEIGGIHPDGKNMLIAIVSSAEKAWPLPWYLRKYKRAGYWSGKSDLPAGIDFPVVITDSVNDADFSSRLKGEYQTEYYRLRPDVLLSIHIENAVWDAFLKSLSKHT